VATSEVSEASEVARGHRGCGPQSESVAVPAVKKKRSVGTTIDGLKLKISQLEPASVSEAATQGLTKNIHIASLQKGNAALQEKL
jgi:hypothetical protein